MFRLGVVGWFVFVVAVVSSSVGVIPHLVVSVAWRGVIIAGNGDCLFYGGFPLFGTTHLICCANL